MIRLRVLPPAALLLLATPLFAQGMMHMPGMTMTMPMPKAAPVKRTPPRPASTKKRAVPAHRTTPVAPVANACPPEHAAMGHCTPADPAPAPVVTMPDMPADTPTAAPCPPEHAAMGHCTATVPAMPDMPMDVPAANDCPPEHAAMGHCTPTPPRKADPDASGTALPAGNAPPPAPPKTRAADRFYPAGAMARADAAMRREHGGMTFSQILFNLAEIQTGRGRDGYRWDGEGWFGGDIHRLVVKTEGEGRFGRSLDAGEVQALYARAIDPYFNLQAGLRHDVGSGPDRSYAVVGIEGLAPYWFDVEAALFLSDKGDLLGRIEATYDQRIIQRLILQPRIETNLAAQDMRANGIGSGLTNIEAGLRLRYEVAREFAPYVGVSWDRKLGDTARFARATGDRAGAPAFVAGIRTWF